MNAAEKQQVIDALAAVSIPVGQDILPSIVHAFDGFAHAVDTCRAQLAEAVTAQEEASALERAHKTLVTIYNECVIKGGRHAAKVAAIEREVEDYRAGPNYAFFKEWCPDRETQMLEMKLRQSWTAMEYKYCRNMADMALELVIKHCPSRA